MECTRNRILTIVLTIIFYCLLIVPLLICQLAILTKDYNKILNFKKASQNESEDIDKNTAEKLMFSNEICATTPAHES